MKQSHPLMVRRMFALSVAGLLALTACGGSDADNAASDTTAAASDSSAADIAAARVTKYLQTITEIDLGDTIGAAEVPDIDHLLDGMQPLLQPSDITLHLHDTRGMAAACVERSLLRGVRSFDSSAAGLGGCPYAPGATGNICTEDLIHALEISGYRCGVNLDALIETTRDLEKLLGHTTPGQVMKAGPRLSSPREVIAPRENTPERTM
jgi:isopropylmalate/homocitrate/citramalate synthase